MAGAPPALADGYCGHDLYRTTACPLHQGVGATGVYEQDSTSNWFVFYARPDSMLTVSIADDENSACTIPPANCSSALASIWHSHRHLAQTPLAGPQEGPSPAPVSLHERAGGIYEVQVTGALGSAGPFTYTLTATGSPAIAWPPCRVPPLRRRTRLRAARRSLAQFNCSVGRVTRVRDRSVPRGDVIRLRPRPRTIAPPRHKVAIIVSSGP